MNRKILIIYYFRLLCFPEKRINPSGVNSLPGRVFGKSSTFYNFNRTIVVFSVLKPILEKTRMELLKGGETMVLLNLSGHPAPEGSEEEFSSIVSVDVPNVDMSDGEAVKETAVNLVEQVLEKAETEQVEALLKGEAALLPPGASTLALAVHAVLSGLVGDSLNLRWAVRTEEGFELSPSLGLWGLSHRGRALRAEVRE